MEPAHAFGLAASLACAAAYALLLCRLRGFEAAARARAVRPPWWFGYARDGANLAATLAWVGALRLIGWSGPASLLLGVGVTLATYLFDWWVGRHLALPSAPAWSFGFGATLSAVAAAAAHRLATAVEALLAAASPR